MAGVFSLSTRLRTAIRQWLNTILIRERHPYPNEAFCLVGVELPQNGPSTSKFTLESIFDNGFVWAVPKHRRTVEKRLNRKYGYPDYFWKLLKPKNHLRTCTTCGDDYETGVLCPTCYKKVIEETKAMQDAIQEELKLEPVENEVVVLYEGEKDGEFYQGKRIVEMKKPRPAWFSKNLLQGTTQKPAQTSDVKPSDLG